MTINNLKEQIDTILKVKGITGDEHVLVYVTSGKGKDQGPVLISGTIMPPIRLKDNVETEIGMIAFTPENQLEKMRLKFLNKVYEVPRGFNLRQVGKVK